MTKTEKTSSGVGGAAASLVGGRMMVASRYAECLHRLARQAGRIELVELSEKLAEVASLIQEMADEIGVDPRGGIVLRKAGRLIGTVEAAVDRAARQATLH